MVYMNGRGRAWGGFLWAAACNEQAQKNYEKYQQEKGWHYYELQLVDSNH